MTLAAEPPKEVFEFRMLWSDGRYRGYTIQIIALFIFMLVFAWLINNVIENLAALGKDFNFSFLWQPASYDINQRLIEYDSRSPHWRAALVGILNTLVLAFVGCITATLLGVFAGVARLSKNWLVAKIMLVYVEFVRNVPLLVQILLCVALFNELLPAPRQAEAALWGNFIATNRGLYVTMPVFQEGFNIVFWAFVAACFGVWGFRRWAKKRQDETGEIVPVLWISIAILAVPTLIVFLAMGSPMSFSQPEPGRFNITGGLQLRDSLIGLWFALTVYTGAFIAEIVRSGIQAISKGQTEASFALGLRPGPTMNLVILPQALRVIIPPLISQYLNLTKNSSLAIAVGYMDVTGTLGGITLNQTGREMECLILLMAFYLAVSLTISFVMNIYNESVKLKGR